MKIKLIFTIFLLLFTFTFVRAQETPSLDPSLQTQVNDAENNYRDVFDTYRTAYGEYTRTKAVWESTGTLKAEQEALAAAKTAATARNNVMIAYTRWLRLQLLQFTSTYDKVVPIGSRLEQQILWFENHTARISATTDITTFDQIMAEYADPATVRGREYLYNLAQLELKLANLAFYQHQARALYEPVLDILETQTGIPEITQGFVRINQLNDSINNDLVSISNDANAEPINKFSERTFHREYNERLVALQANQLSLLNYILELEARYAR